MPLIIVIVNADNDDKISLTQSDLNENLTTNNNNHSYKPLIHGVFLATKSGGGDQPLCWQVGAVVHRSSRKFRVRKLLENER